MKEIVVLFVILLSVVGFVYAQHTGGSGGSGGRGGEAYSCMLDEEIWDCVDGHDNYCICDKE